MSFFKGFVPRIGRETFPPGLYERSANALPQREKMSPRGSMNAMNTMNTVSAGSFTSARYTRVVTLSVSPADWQSARRQCQAPAALSRRLGVFWSAAHTLPQTCVCGPRQLENRAPERIPRQPAKRGRRRSRCRRVFFGDGDSCRVESRPTFGPAALSWRLVLFWSVPHPLSQNRSDCRCRKQNQAEIPGKRVKRKVFFS